MSDLFEAIWAEVRDLPEFDWADVAKRGCGTDTAKRYIRLWLKDGRIRVSRLGVNNKRYYSPSHLPPAGPQPVSADASPEGNMWRAMRSPGLRHGFTPTDLACHANAGGVEVSVEKARAYCRRLLGSGHLKVRQTAIPGRREAIYQLIEDSGPRPPKPVRLAGILDPNTGEFTPVKGGAA
jgi:hypothetical protein